MPVIYKNGIAYSGDGDGGSSTWEGTLAQYNAIPVKDPDTVYYVTDATPPVTGALAVTYNNSTSGLSATNVQAAIDEVAQGGGGGVTPPADYDSTETYSLGDFVTYNGDIYMCISAITTPEAWNSNHWSLTDADQSYLHSLNPKGAGSFSLNRKSNTTIGNCSFVEGYNCTASGDYSHAEGYTVSATASVCSHAEGMNTMASGVCSHAEGYFTIASGDFGSHTEGYYTTASGHYGSHTEGYSTTASGDYSHAEGRYTTANHRSQHTFGEYNVLDASTATATNRGNYIEIVGNGTASNARSNARTLDWSGNEVLSGGLKINGDKDVPSHVSLSQSDYDALVQAGTVDNNTIYFITDGDTPACSATQVTYSNTTSSLTATNVQGAIDEVVSDINSGLNGKLDKSLVDLVGTVGTGFQYVSEKRCLLYFYSDTAHANGFRVEFNGLTKQIILQSMANGIPTTLATFTGT